MAELEELGDVAANIRGRGIPRIARVKNKAPAPIQITAEQLLREAMERQDAEPKVAHFLCAHVLIANSHQNKKSLIQKNLQIIG